MQTIERLLQISGSAGRWTNELGKPAANPEIAIGVRARLQLDLRSTETDDATHVLLPCAIENVRSTSYYLALDSDFTQETPPRMVTLSGIDVFQENDHTFLYADLPNTARSELLDALAAGETVILHAELGGYDPERGVNNADFVIQFSLTLRNRVWLGGDVPPEVEENPEYLTADEVVALINEAALQPGPQGNPGLSAYEIAVAGGYAGSSAEWLESLRGEPGKSAYEIAVAGGYEGSSDEWLESLRGEPGLSAYDIAVLEGFRGNTAEWLESLRGSDGQDLHLDATGELSELDAYADEAQGFTFGASVTESTTRTTKLYIYVKRSNDYNDWCSPTVITYYERNSEVKTIAPVEFTAPDAGAEYLSIDVSRYPHATAVAVCIDTEEGELILPYYSALGVRKIVKKSGTLRIYPGAQIPQYSTGRVYLSQFLGAVEVMEPELPSGTVYYGYIPQEVLGTVYRVGNITLEMLQDSRSAMTEASAGTIDKTSLGTVPAGSLAVVLLPSGSGLTAEKFDGVGGYTSFNENNVETGTGANGAGILLDGTAYDVYGEFVLASAEISIRIITEE